MCMGLTISECENVFDGNDFHSAIINWPLRSSIKHKFEAEKAQSKITAW